MAAKLIVNADDFGYSWETTEGIIRVFEKGIVTSTTLIVNGFFFEKAVKYAKDNRRLSVGIHLNLTSGKAISEKNRIFTIIQKNGIFWKNPLDLTMKLISKKINTAHVERELEAQICRFLDTGLIPSHIDSHGHVHLLPMILPIVIKIAHKYKIRRIRIPLEPLLFNKTLKNYLLNKAQFRILHLNLLCLWAMKIIEKAGMVTTDSFYGTSFSGKLNKTVFLSILDNIKTGVVEIMCHPGVSNKSLWGNLSDELELLSDSSMIAEIKKRNIDLISYNDL